MLTVRNYIEAAKRRKYEETGEEGFTLIELIIVVVILGILAAVAIPIFLNIQQQAKQSALATTTANAATQTATALAQTPPVDVAGTATFYDNLLNSNPNYNLAVAVGPNGSGTTLTTDNFCVTGTDTTDGLTAVTAGPGC